MNYFSAVAVGAFIRWLFKRCRTKLSDEFHGNLPGVFLKDYQNENYIIGISFIIFLFIISCVCISIFN